jgi:hypothetical protein
VRHLGTAWLLAVLYKTGQRQTQIVFRMTGGQRGQHIAAKVLSSGRLQFPGVCVDRSKRMSVKNSLGTVLIRGNTLLPAGLALRTETFLPGWKILREMDADRLGQKLEKAQWYFFYLASETKAIVFGREKAGALSRAAKQILGKRKAQQWNSFEITSVASKSFLGIPFLCVAGNFRHIQESVYLIPRRGTAAGMPAIAAPRIAPESIGRQSLVEARTKDSAIQTASL